MNEKQNINHSGIIIFIAGSLIFGIITNIFFEKTVWAEDGIIFSKSITAVEFPISLNDAAPEQLMALPGVGLALAERIIKYREDKGEFKTRCELRKICGIGPRMYEKIKEKIYVSGDLTPDASNPEEIDNSAETENQKIDINLAVIDHFKKIKGLGEKIGSKIIDYRQKIGGRIQKIEELSTIGGIGAKRIQTLKKYFIAY